MPEIVIVAGPNGAGKTTFAREYSAATQKHLVFVNADEIAREVKYQLQPHQKMDAHAAKIMLERINDLASARAGFMFETTLATRTYIRKIPQWRRSGYAVSIVYLRLPSVDASISRVRRRVEAGGHSIPEEVIRRRFSRSMNYFENIYKSIVDEWYVWDSLEGAFVLAESWDRT